MTKKFKTPAAGIRSGILIFVFLFIGQLPLFSENGNWVIAAQKFKYARGQTEGAVQNAMAEMIPVSILENLNRSLQRNVMPDEQLERALYKLRTERQSLYLQLSSEYKKRDSLVISYYSDTNLKSALRDEEKKIKEIQDKIDKNLEEVKKQTNETSKKMELITKNNIGDENEELSEFDKFGLLFKNIFIKDRNLYTEEKVALYRNDISSLFSPSEKAVAKGITSGTFEKEVVSAGINSLIVGTITGYGEYVSVSAELFLYPGAKSAGVVTEVGSSNDMEFVASSIAMQLLPKLTNAMPVQLKIEISPQSAADDTEIYIDDVLQTDDIDNFMLDSGVHNIQFISKNYRTAGTNYYFEGNRKYSIKVEFEELKIGTLQLGLKKNLPGEVYANGEKGLPLSDGKSKISIDGKAILGEFIAENGETSFFYIPKKNAVDGKFLTINPKPMDRMHYIDTRRKWMYGAYSAFMLSLIPAFYTDGQFKNKSQLYNKGQIDFSEANNYQIAMNVSKIISIACGVFWGYELVRYLMAANSVLPQKARKGNPADFIMDYSTNSEPDVSQDNSNNDSNENTIADGEQKDEEVIR